MTETFERHRSNQNRNTNRNKQNSERIQKIIFITVDFIKARVYNQKIKLSRLMKTINFAVSEHNSRVYSLIFLQVII